MSVLKPKRNESSIEYIRLANDYVMMMTDTVIPTDEVVSEEVSE